MTRTNYEPLRKSGEDCESCGTSYETCSVGIFTARGKACCGALFSTDTTRREVNGR